MSDMLICFELNHFWPSIQVGQWRRCWTSPLFSHIQILAAATPAAWARSSLGGAGEGIYYAHWSWEFSDPKRQACESKSIGLSLVYLLTTNRTTTAAAATIATAAANYYHHNHYHNQNNQYYFTIIKYYHRHYDCLASIATATITIISITTITNINYWLLTTNY